MYTVSVETTFCATHRVTLPDGSLEAVHGHDWRVVAVFARASLDDHGMVVDFCEAERVLEKVVADFRHTNLNELEIFSGLSTTAEVVARVLFDRVATSGLDSLVRVEITEAPGCLATYQRDSV
jgi:6-pyruvoyltetrahydropterin/6-carboxytetrahydropterin synthase